MSGLRAMELRAAEARRLMGRGAKTGEAEGVALDKIM